MPLQNFNFSSDISAISVLSDYFGNGLNLVTYSFDCLISEYFYDIRFSLKGFIFQIILPIVLIST